MKILQGVCRLNELIRKRHRKYKTRTDGTDIAMLKTMERNIFGVFKFEIKYTGHSIIQFEEYISKRRPNAATQEKS